MEAPIQNVNRLDWNVLSARLLQARHLRRAGAPSRFTVGLGRVALGSQWLLRPANTVAASILCTMRAGGRSLQMYVDLS
jgi:hypothetical protein